MHAHACLSSSVRTTIEISDENRAKLLELAARRGEKGFSRLVDEAVTRYLAGLEEREKAKRKAIALKGTLLACEADGLRAATEQIRGKWR